MWWVSEERRLRNLAETSEPWASGGRKATNAPLRVQKLPGMAAPQSDRPAAANQERRQVFYEGRVQGVGFRYTTLEIAGRYRVSGYVRNLPDGRVGLEAEGEPAELERFLASVAERLRRYIVHIDCRTKPATGEFGQFEIRH